jgi:hypothetical protein
MDILKKIKRHFNHDITDWFVSGLEKLPADMVIKKMYFQQWNTKYPDRINTPFFTVGSFCFNQINCFAINGSRFFPCSDGKPRTLYDCSEDNIKNSNNLNFSVSHLLNAIKRMNESFRQLTVIHGETQFCTLGFSYVKIDCVTIESSNKFYVIKSDGNITDNWLWWKDDTRINYSYFI